MILAVKAAAVTVEYKPVQALATDAIRASFAPTYIPVTSHTVPQLQVEKGVFFAALVADVRALGGGGLFDGDDLVELFCVFDAFALAAALVKVLTASALAVLIEPGFLADALGRVTLARVGLPAALDVAPAFTVGRELRQMLAATEETEVGVAALEAGWSARQAFISGAVEVETLILFAGEALASLGVALLAQGQIASLALGVLQEVPLRALLASLCVGALLAHHFGGVGVTVGAGFLILSEETHLAGVALCWAGNGTLVTIGDLTCGIQARVRVLIKPETLIALLASRWVRGASRTLLDLTG